MAKGASALEAAFNDRLAAGKKHFAAGGKVCGYYGNGMPVEVAIATGHLPMAVMPLPDRKTPHADEWVNDTFHPQLKLIFDQLLSNELGFVDLVVAISQASPDSLVFQSVRELLRQGKGGHIPPLHSYSLLGLQHEAVREYGRLQIDALARRLRANSGVEATPARLREAIDLTNAIRGQWRALDAARRRGVVSGVEAIRIMSAARFMPGAEYLEGVTAAVKGLGSKRIGGPRVLVVSNTSLGDTKLHQALEAGGCVVVGEDDWWGARQAAPDIAAGDDPMGAIYAHHYKHVPNRSIYPATVRLGWLYENALKADVDGVVIHMTRADRSLGWDYPRLRDYLYDNNKPMMMLRDDASTGEGAQAATAAAKKFVERLQEKVG